MADEVAVGQDESDIADVADVVDADGSGIRDKLTEIVDEGYYMFLLDIVVVAGMVAGVSLTVVVAISCTVAVVEKDMVGLVIDTFME